MSNDNQYHDEMPDEAYYDMLEQQEIGDATDERVRECIEEYQHEMPITAVSVRWDSGSAEYYAWYECTECEICVPEQIDHDDYLYHKNRGVTVA